MEVMKVRVAKLESALAQRRALKLVIGLYFLTASFVGATHVVMTQRAAATALAVIERLLGNEISANIMSGGSVAIRQIQASSVGNTLLSMLSWVMTIVDKFWVTVGYFGYTTIFSGCDGEPEIP